MRRVERYWRTPFGRWIGAVSVQRVVAGLTVAGCPIGTTAVYHWIAGRRVPRLPHALALARLSAGRLAVEDVLEHRRLVREG